MSDRSGRRGYVRTVAGETWQRCRPTPALGAPGVRARWEGEARLLSNIYLHVLSQSNKKRTKLGFPAPLPEPVPAGSV